MGGYVPKVSPERAERLLRWHRDVAAELRASPARDVTYLGLELHIPEQVFPPTPVSDLLGRQVLAQVHSGQRVLDMGCGAGANAILAAQRTDDVVAVDINPASAAATAANAGRNGVAARVRCLESDLFDRVDGTFDVIVIDPPFRWFAPRDLIERAVTDDGYQTLGRSFDQAGDRLTPAGCVLLFFGSSGDVAHLDDLTARASLATETLAERTIEARGEDTTYFVRRLTKP